MFVAKIEELLNGPFVDVHPVLVKGVGKLIVKRRTKNFEVAVPLRAAKKDQMVFVDLAYTGDDFSIQGLKLWVQGDGVEVGGDRLVKQIVTQNRRFVSETRGDLSPDIDGQLLTLGAFEQKRISPTVVDVISSLSARRAMHVQNNRKTFLLAPGDNLVQQFVTRTFKFLLFTFGDKKPIAEGHTNRVET